MILLGTITGEVYANWLGKEKIQLEKEIESGKKRPPPRRADRGFTSTYSNHRPLHVSPIIVLLIE